MACSTAKHDEAGATHLPERHCDGELQLLLHAPQWAASVLTSTQAAPQRVRHLSFCRHWVAGLVKVQLEVLTAVLQVAQPAGWGAPFLWQAPPMVQ